MCLYTCGVRFVLLATRQEVAFLGLWWLVAMYLSQQLGGAPIEWRTTTK